ncbi:glutathione S-transferase [Schizopora paradoxa]|uniref:glutathione transferase n=1 Tax=Schizopora paradoxa TaxID=27342 RepID=A0A0H2SC83_9AGAM|nr:glutathione S-transferase [Schizopora paradoxa]
MVLKLYGSAIATCTQRVLAVANQLGVSVELVIVNLAAQENKAPEYMKKQPFGQVPYLDDDGFILFESRAISRYLSTVHASGNLIPKEAKENAIFEQAVSIEQSNFDPFTTVLARERFYYPLFRGANYKPDEVAAQEAQAKLEAKLDAYEVILSKHAYLGGDKLTLADLFHLPYGAMASSPRTPGAPYLNLEDPKRPNVARWWKEIVSLPAWKAVSAQAQTELAALKKA